MVGRRMLTRWLTADLNRLCRHLRPARADPWSAGNARRRLHPSSPFCSRTRAGSLAHDQKTSGLHVGVNRVVVLPSCQAVQGAQGGEMAGEGAHRLDAPMSQSLSTLRVPSAARSSPGECACRPAGGSRIECQCDMEKMFSRRGEELPRGDRDAGERCRREFK
jgi:hypothetical protein